MLEQVDGHLSENVEMYLKTILLVGKEAGGAAKTGDISKELKVSPAAVTEMLDRLVKEGYAKHEKYKGATLTKAGEKRARDILRKHCIMERFLVETLEMRNGDYHDQACRLEHVISDDMAERLNRLSKVKSQCPDCYSLEKKHCALLVV